MTASVQELFGEIDIYVFDQILRGNIAPGMRILDAGCGYGRNLVYLLRERAEIFAIDASPKAVEHVRQLSKSLGASLPAENFPGRTRRATALSRRLCRRCSLQLRSPLRSQRRAVSRHARRTLARPSSRRSPLLPSRLEHRHGFRTDRQRTLRHARRPSLVFGRRTKVDGSDGEHERRLGGSIEDDDRAESPLHDDLGRSENHNSLADFILCRGGFTLPSSRPARRLHKNYKIALHTTVLSA